MADDKEVQLKKRQILTPRFRASYAHVIKPQERKPGDGKPMYSIEMLFDKSEVSIGTIQKPLLEALRQKFGADKAKWPKPLLLPYQDGDKPLGRKKKVRPEAAGMWVVKASTKADYTAPPVVDEHGTTLTEKEFYSGCYARAQVTALAYDNESFGVKFLLDGVQKLEDGEPLGGRKSAAEMFGIQEQPAGDEADDLGEGEDIGSDESEEQESFL